MNFLELFNRNGLIAAHRGARSISPENTLSALKKSIGHCDFIEVDVQLSCDGIPIIIHDETLTRTTNIEDISEYKNMKPYRVSDFTFKELSTLDYGSWFYRDDPFHYIMEKKLNTINIKNKSEPLLSLRDTLKFIKKHQLFINIEIKDMEKYFSDEDVVSIILKEIKNMQVENLVLISSFRAEYLSLSKNSMVNIPTALLVANKHPSNLIEYLNNLQVDGYNIDNKLVDKKTIDIVKKAGFFINVYTVNSPTDQNKLFKMGINGVFTDLVK
ncbi:MAG: glycerophosphodiester phosphodiesterase family protein [Campylobacterota bacterium]|nr:glycerophosphodiester phosphodiesterase family protein [Campylobacterota bacterium]